MLAQDSPEVRVRTSVRALVTDEGSSKAAGSSSKTVHSHSYLEEASAPHPVDLFLRPLKCVLTTCQLASHRVGDPRKREQGGATVPFMP